MWYGNREENRKYGKGNCGNAGRIGGDKGKFGKGRGKYKLG